MGIIKTAKEAYEYCYQNGPIFPSDWSITQNFTWNEAFKNETKSDGIPIYEVFQNIEKLARVLQYARSKIGKAFIIHCWYRSIPHNIRAGSTALYSPHLNGSAVDFHIRGESPEHSRAVLLTLDLPLRIEDETKTWVHVDTGNTYTGNYRYGLFKA